MSETLKPCPMCGSHPVVDGRSDDVRVRCESCGTTGPVRHWGEHDDEDAADAAIDAAEADAVAAWNQRAHPAPSEPSEVARLRAVIDGDRAQVVAALYGDEIAKQRGYQAGDLDRLIARERAARAQVWREAATLCEAEAASLRALSAQCDGDDGNLAAQANALDEMTKVLLARAEKEQG